MDLIPGKLGDLDNWEVACLREPLSTPVDIPDFPSCVPEGMKEQDGEVSPEAVELDDRSDVRNFLPLAPGLEIPSKGRDKIHSRLGQPQIFV